MREFVVDLSPSGRTVADVNRGLLERGICGGLDLSRTMPKLGQAMLVALDETKTQADIDRYADALTEVLT